MSGPVRTIEEAVTACYGGYLASARKTGRNPNWPYVPVYKSPDPYVGGHFHETQIRARAYRTRDEAVQVAGLYIEALRDGMRRSLADPRSRAHRAQWGVPDAMVADLAKGGAA